MDIETIVSKDKNDRSYSSKILCIRGFLILEEFVLEDYYIEDFYITISAIVCENSKVKNYSEFYIIYI
jgi:hypothetical protein